MRVSDDFYDHPKFTDLNAISIALWIAGLAYCNRNLTDGYLTESVAARLVDYDGISYTTATIGNLAAIEESDCFPLALWRLIENGLWHQDNHECPDCPQPGRKRLYIHDYLTYQPSAEQVKARAEERAESGRKGAAKRWGKAG